MRPGWPILWMLSAWLFMSLACPATPVPNENVTVPGESGADISTSEPSNTDAPSSPEPTRDEATQSNEPSPPERRVELALERRVEPALSESNVPDTTAEKNMLPEPVRELIPDATVATGPCTFGGGAPRKYDVGKVYWGRNSYIQYIPGNMPLIFSAPHGGSLKPSEIPNRTKGTLLADTNSMEVTLETAHVIYKQTGLLPHIVMNRLHRVKLDANREIKEAAAGNQWAEQAWREFHVFIDAAKSWVTTHCRRGHYFDFHTNAHAAQWSEFGFLLSGSDLKFSDATLQQSRYRDKSSLKALVTWSGTALPALLRGPDSMGALVMAGGFKSVPSPTHPDPGSEKYFSGGYNTARHGSRGGGTIDGTQIETYTGFGRTDRSGYSAKLGAAILRFMEVHYKRKLRTTIWQPPPHARCLAARSLAFDAKGVIKLDGTTLGASNEFGTAVRCGKSFGIAGPQTYYKIALDANRSYKLSFTPSFAARIYLFRDSCTVSDINKSCSTSVLKGDLIGTNKTLDVAIKPPATATYILAIDSRNPAWYGAFSLSLTTVK